MNALLLSLYVALFVSVFLGTYLTLVSGVSMIEGENSGMKYVLAFLFLMLSAMLIVAVVLAGPEATYIEATIKAVVIYLIGLTLGLGVGMLRARTVLKKSSSSSG